MKPRLLSQWPKGEPVPAISVRQPWAAAIVWFGKDIENRSYWPFSYRGPVLIQSSRTEPTEDDIEIMCEIAEEAGVDSKTILAHFDELNELAMPYGCIVGVAHLYDVLAIDEMPPKGHPVEHSPWGDDANWLCLSDVEPVVPVPWKGQVGLFKVPYDVADSLQVLERKESPKASRGKSRKGAESSEGESKPAARTSGGKPKKRKG